VTFVALAAAFLAGAAIGALIAWLATRPHLSLAEKNVELLLERAKSDLRQAIADLEAKRERDSGSLREQIDQLLGRAEKLEHATASLTTQTSTLVTALRNPASRGRWGEMQLRNVVEKAGMLAHCDFVEQQTVALEAARVRPDMTINLPGNRRVFVDAKAPVDAMQAALEAIDDDSRRALIKQHARALRDHADALARRGYHTAPGSADYVVMFVPGEAFLNAACSEDPVLIEYALDKGVLITGPLALISLLRTFAMGWQALVQEENAKRIAGIGKVLYERALKFAEHLSEIRKHLERSVNAFNGAIGSYETKLLPQGRKLKEEAAFPGDEPAAIPPIDVVPREVGALDAAAPQHRQPRAQRLFAGDE
jgi:DNA recombination protein RmuC